LGGKKLIGKRGDHAVFSIENGYGQIEDEKQYILTKEKQISQSIYRQEELIFITFFRAA
jgi:hypothetical protein